MLPAANGYRFSVSAVAAERKRDPSIYIRVSKGRRYEVQYLARGLSTSDGRVKARLPGVGRIAVRFNELSISREAIADNCKGRADVIRHGWFEGRIELHGEHGYTRVYGRRARGSIRQSFRHVCDQREFGHEGSGAGRSFHLESLYAGSEGQRRLDFSVSRFDPGAKFGEPSVFFSASSSTQRHGFSVVSSVSVEGKPTMFLTPDPAGVLEDASISPPAPFHGSATFHLNSPTSADWEGTLGVELPGIGDTALAGEGFWSALCEDATCTKTLPPNVQILSIGTEG